MRRNKKAAGEAVPAKTSKNILTTLTAAGEKAGSKVGELLGAGRSAQQEKGWNRAKLLVSIVNRSDEKKLKEILDDCSVSLSYLFEGMGTAHSAVLDYFGIGETEKRILLSLFPESDEEIVMREIRAKMALYLVGRGISFTVPLSGISQTVAEGIAGAATNKTTDGRKKMTSQDRKYNLIIASVAANFVDTAMEAAREAGAAGGTIVRARTMQNAKAEQFIGISLMREQEILMILARKENTMPIMNALSERVGAKTQAGGVIFSVPVDSTAGISVTEEEELVRSAEKGDRSEDTK